MDDPESPAGGGSRRCDRCGAELGPDVGAGAGAMCPACLLQAALPETTAASGRPRFAAPPPAELQPHFPELELLELTGQGGMGAVYRARQKRLDRVVALKVLPPELSRDPAFAERFRREAVALARLNHPHLVTVHDVGETAGWCWILMEHVDGANLRQVLSTGALSAAQALAIVPQLCEALQYAHDEGVVHRDIKPENILMDRRGQVKIADFGLAKLLEAPVGDRLTGTGELMGTPHYMAPEQVERSRAVDHRADLYSLGVLLYEMLTGTLPLGRFEAPSRSAGVDPALDAVVHKALERDPARRYQQADEVRTDVERVSAGVAAAEASATPAPAAEVERWGPAHEIDGLILLLGGGACALLAVGLLLNGIHSQVSAAAEIARSSHYSVTYHTPDYGTTLLAIAIAGLTSLGGWHLGQRRDHRLVFVARLCAVAPIALYLWQPLIGIVASILAWRRFWSRWGHRFETRALRAFRESPLLRESAPRPERTAPSSTAGTSPGPAPAGPTAARRRDGGPAVVLGSVLGSGLILLVIVLAGTGALTAPLMAVIAVAIVMVVAIVASASVARRRGGVDSRPAGPVTTFIGGVFKLLMVLVVCASILAALGLGLVVARGESLPAAFERWSQLAAGVPAAVPDRAIDSETAAAIERDPAAVIVEYALALPGVRGRHAWEASGSGVTMHTRPNTIIALGESDHPAYTRMREAAEQLRTMAGEVHELAPGRTLPSAQSSLSLARTVDDSAIELEAMARSANIHLLPPTTAHLRTIRAATAAVLRAPERIGAMREETFQHLLRSLGSETTRITEAATVAARRYCFTAAQVQRVLEHARTNGERAEVVAILRPRVTDPERLFVETSAASVAGGVAWAVSIPPAPAESDAAGPDLLVLDEDAGDPEGLQYRDRARKLNDIMRRHADRGWRPWFGVRRDQGLQQLVFGERSPGVYGVRREAFEAFARMLAMPPPKGGGYAKAKWIVASRRAVEAPEPPAPAAVPVAPAADPPVAPTAPTRPEG